MIKHYNDDILGPRCILTLDIPAILRQREANGDNPAVCVALNQLPGVLASWMSSNGSAQRVVVKMNDGLERESLPVGEEIYRRRCELDFCASVADAIERAIPRGKQP